MIELAADADPAKRWNTCWLEVTSTELAVEGPRWKACVSDYLMMCDSIMSDIGSAEGSGMTMLENLRRVASGEADHIEAGGNAWITHITRDKVWFEGLHGQGDGGEVRFEQYTLAVQVYVRFLADPEHKPIEVPLPRS
jgi:hypothetical protein